MQRMILSAAALTLLCAAPALAGGRYVAACPTGTVATQDRLGLAVCAAPARASEVVVVEQVGPARPARLICPYPHRPSDSAFIGGAGYLTKDQVRRRMGCR